MHNVLYIKLWSLVLTDVLSEFGYLFLGSRLKRLSERLQANAADIHKRYGHENVQPAIFAVLAALDLEDGLTIGTLVERLGISQPAVTRSVSGMAEEGYVRFEQSSSDQRIKRVRLTEKGRALTADAKATSLRDIRQAAKHLSDEVGGDVLGMIAALEAGLLKQSLIERSKAPHSLSIVEYAPDLATYFYTINEEWISSMYSMEPTDVAVLSDPETHIISKGGEILFVKSEVNGIIGAGALMPVDDEGSIELTKMGVSEVSRGEKAGEFLLANLIAKAKEMKVKKLFLLTNSGCEAAIHLYEKLGFLHDADIMTTYGQKYDRCDVAMTFPLLTV